jgi:hypothetical protein
MGNSFLDWLWAVGLASLGIVARLGHAWAQSKQDADAKQVTARDMIGALIAAPTLGIIGMGIGQWLKLPDASIGAMIGFMGLLGPAALIAIWDKVADAALSVFKGRNGGDK